MTLRNVNRGQRIQSDDVQQIIDWINTYEATQGGGGGPVTELDLDVLRLADGSLAAPSLTFQNSLSTGWRYALDSGTEELRGGVGGKDGPYFYRADPGGSSDWVSMQLGGRIGWVGEYGDFDIIRDIWLDGSSQKYRGRSFHFREVNNPVQMLCSKYRNTLAQSASIWDVSNKTTNRHYGDGSFDDVIGGWIARWEGFAVVQDAGGVGYPDEKLCTRIGMKGDPVGGNVTNSVGNHSLTSTGGMIILGVTPRGSVASITDVLYITPGGAKCGIKIAENADVPAGITLDVNGIIRATGPLDTSSDERLKDVTGDLDGALEIVRSVAPVKFKWNKRAPDSYHQGNSGEQLGFLAQEMETFVPEAVSIGDGRTHGVPYEDMRGIQYERLIPVLWQAIRELSEQLIPGEPVTQPKRRKSRRKAA